MFSFLTKHGNITINRWVYEPLELLKLNLFIKLRIKKTI
jgi:hypothetical protein